ncbi:uncharacterized protein LOC111046656 isoform X3 [Nilaparvata lugens]|uniref:uncharacterized protein LOC111046656 isoform X2 n=1 Tax=Nilaparvata lugens TaxID=108931 RepID=UPI00193DC5A8|nr:uncharacterized protein LOC111046656 isoform X2 [Nilaparvata lugens]XP_039292434.1 uncharacterized protein LOC111046656 isoform X3 [Nilaparvata lugens]
MTKMFGRQSNSSTKTILLKSPDSDRVREVVITEIVVPNSRNSVERISQIDRMDTKNMSKPPRKRRLDHLSQEEKIMRKKLKNREAAQTSRDRKKARLEELESAVCRLQKQCDILCDKYETVSLERDALKRELAAANEELWRCRVEGDLKVDLKGDLKVDAAVMTEGPAVSLSLSLPLPQGLTAVVPISVSPPLARRLPALANHRQNHFPYAQWSPFQLPHLQLVVLVILADLADDVIDCWLSNSDKVGTPDFEELELFADSLFKQAMDFEEADNFLPCIPESSGDSMDSDGPSAACSPSADSMQTYASSSTAASPLATYNASTELEMEEVKHVVSNDIIPSQHSLFKPYLTLEPGNINVESAEQRNINVNSAGETIGTSQNVCRESVGEQRNMNVLATEQRNIKVLPEAPKNVYKQSVGEQRNMSVLATEQRNIKLLPANGVTEAPKNVYKQSLEEMCNIRIKSEDDVTDVPKKICVEEKRNMSVQYTNGVTSLVCRESVADKICVQPTDTQKKAIIRPTAQRNIRVKPADSLKTVGRPYVPIQPRVAEPSAEPIVLICTQSADEGGNFVFMGDVVIGEVCCTTAVAEEVVISEDCDNNSYCQDSSSYCPDTDDSDVEIVEVDEKPSLIELGEKCFCEEGHSDDHGYESIGSPDSDVNATVNLRQLFPELW